LGELYQHQFNKKDQDKPCKTLNYCPYGALVEFFPLKDVIPDITRQSIWLQAMEKIPSAQKCNVYGHDCPFYYVAEGFKDDGLEYV
jgi:hypothetical protein